jgi:hypothetical protein
MRRSRDRKLFLDHGADPDCDFRQHDVADGGVRSGCRGVFTFGIRKRGARTREAARKSGARVNDANEDKSSVAVRRTRAGRVVLWLVDHGADLAAKDKGQDYGFGVSTVRMTPLNWAEGVPIGMSSAIYHDETVALLARLMRERGIPVVYNSFQGRVQGDAPIIETPK